MATTASSTPTQTVQYNYGFAPEVAPYAQDLLGMGAAASYTYAKDASGNVIRSPQVDASGNPILDSNGKPLPGMPQISGFQPYQQYQGDQVAQFSPLQQQSFAGAQNMQAAPQLNAASQLSGAAGLGALNTNYNYQPGSFTNAGTAQQYMNPYLMNALAPQLAIQQQLQGAAQQTQNAQAAQAGAFGGSRAGVQAAATGLNNQLANQNLIGKGYYDAFNNAQSQFNTENQLGTQNAQFGAGLGLQGLQTANAAAQNLAGIGNQQYTQNMGINALQNQYGTQQQQQMQNVLNTQYQNFVNQMNYPYQQLAFMSNLVNKVPMSQTSSSTYQSPASQLGQLAGLGIGAASVLSKAGGGSVSSYKDGGHIKGYSGEDDESLVNDRQIQPLFYASDNPIGMAYKAGVDIPVGRNSNLITGIGGSHMQGPNFKMDEHSGRHIGFGTDVGSGRLSFNHYENPTTRYRENRINYNMAFADGDLVTDPTESKLQGMMRHLSLQQLERIIQAPTMPGEQQAAEEELQSRQLIESQVPVTAAQPPQQGMMYREGGPVAFADEGAVEDKQAQKDRAAMLDTLKRMGAAGYDVLTAPGRGVAGAFESAVTRPARALGIPIPYLPESFYGGNRESMTPYYDKLRAEDAAASSNKTSSYNFPVGNAGRGNVNPPTVSASPVESKPRVSDHPTVQGAHDAAMAHGFSTDDFTKSYKDMLKELREGDVEANKGLTDLITAYGKQAEETKADSVRKAMQDFGFKMAQEASRTGVARAPGFGGVIQSAAAAAPAITESMNASEKAAQDMDKNRLEMQIAQTRYATSLKKGDQQAALGYATQLRQLQMQQAQLAEMHNFHNQQIELSKARVAASTNSLQNTMMRTKAGLATNALKQADKAWSDPLQRMQLEKQGYTHQSYGKELYNNMWSQTMPQLEYMGTLDRGE